MASNLWLKINNKVHVCADFSTEHSSRLVNQVFSWESLQIQHFTMQPYRLRLNGQAEYFDTFKRALKKKYIRTGGVGWKKVAEIIPNPKTKSGMSPAELMFTRKINSVFNKILPKWKAQTSRNIPMNKYFNPGEKNILQYVPRRERTTKEFSSVEPTLKRYRLQRESAPKGRCYVEECADSDLCDLNMDLQSTKTELRSRDRNWIYKWVRKKLDKSNAYAK